jgi:nicotinate-nucleotide adenylyltransferase
LALLNSDALQPLGLFGGRFDPVHRAHIRIAKAVANALALQEIRWVVTGDPEYKPVMAGPEDRLAMVRLALAQLQDPRMLVDDREIIAAAAGGSNYTADTVAGLQKEMPGRRFIWILGEDQLQHFTSWYRWQWLIGQVELAVCARPGAESSRISKRITDQGGVIHWVKIEPDTVSSTEIRNKIQSGTLESGLIPQSVADYIAQRHLYN